MYVRCGWGYIWGEEYNGDGRKRRAGNTYRVGALSTPKYIPPASTDQVIFP